MKKALLILITLMFLNPILSRTPEFKRDWKKMVEFYSGLKCYSISMNIEVRFNDQFHSRVNVESVISDTNSNSLIDGKLRSINGPKHSIIIDSDQELITLSKRSSQLSNYKLGINNIPDSGFSVDSSSSSGMFRYYKLVYKSGPYAYIEMNLDTSSGLITKYVFVSRYPQEYDWKKIGVQTLIISFSGVKKLESIQQEQFLASTYIMWTKKEGYKAKFPYLNYPVLDINSNKRKKL